MDQTLKNFIYDEGDPRIQKMIDSVLDGKDLILPSVESNSRLEDGAELNTSEIASSAQEQVNHPLHYNTNKYECIEVMRSIFGDEAVKTWIKLNIFKYAWRADKKNHDEDIAKIAWYSDYYTKMTDSEKK